MMNNSNSDVIKVTDEYLEFVGFSEFNDTCDVFIFYGGVCDSLTIYPIAKKSDFQTSVCIKDRKISKTDNSHDYALLLTLLQDRKKEKLQEYVFSKLEDTYIMM